MTTANATPPGKTRMFAASIWLASIGALVLIRYRGRIGLFRSFHEWMAESGAADWVRNADSEVLLVVFGVGLWAWMKRGSGGHSAGLLGDLGLGGGVARGCIVGLVIALPMLLLAAVTGGAIAFEWPMVRGVATGPFAEEWFCRGVLVLAFVRLAGVSFWPTAIVSGVLFGLMHVQWTGDGFAHGWPKGLFTTVGGIWYAWLARVGTQLMGRHRRAWPHEPGLAVVRHRQRDLARDRKRHLDHARHRHDDSSGLAAYELGTAGAGVWSVIPSFLWPALIDSRSLDRIPASLDCQLVPVTSTRCTNG